MKIIVHLPLTNNKFNPVPLVTFALTKIEEVENPETTEPSPIWIALCLAATVDDHEFHDQFKKMIVSDSNQSEKILEMSHMFLSVLDRVPPDHPVSTERAYSRPDESICKEILEYAVQEGNHMLFEECIEPEIFKVLVRAGLQCWQWRLCEFEEMCSNTDPETRVRRGIEIARVAMSPEATN